MKIEVEAVRLGGRERAVERLVQFPDRLARKRVAAEDAAVPRGQLDDVPELRLVVEGEEQRIVGDRLDGDAVLPPRAHLGEHRPGDRRLLAEGIDVGAERPGAVRKGAAQRELHARAHVVR